MRVTTLKNKNNVKNMKLMLKMFKKIYIYITACGRQIPGWESSAG